MSATQVRQVNPILGTRDLERTIAFYVERLGFELAFDDPSQPRNYVGLRRDDVELHFQFQYEDEMYRSRLRVLVADPDALHAEYQARQAFANAPVDSKGSSPAKVELTEPLDDKPWGTREFAF